MLTEKENLILNKVLKIISESNSIAEYHGHTNTTRISDRLVIETWAGHCTGINIDGTQVCIFSKSTDEGLEARERIRSAIRNRINQIKTDLIDSL